MSPKSLEELFKPCSDTERKALSRFGRSLKIRAHLGQTTDNPAVLCWIEDRELRRIEIHQSESFYPEAWEQIEKAVRRQMETLLKTPQVTPRL